MHIEGLQAIKPDSVDESSRPPECADGGFAQPVITSKSGLNFEVRLLAREEAANVEMGLGEWLVDSLRISVEEPVKAAA